MNSTRVLQSGFVAKAPTSWPPLDISLVSMRTKLKQKKAYVTAALGTTHHEM
jgi:hypothetical protein